MAGKTLRIYLADGSPNAVLTAEILNWTGKVVIAPRAMLDRLILRPESDKTGVYCLAGFDPKSVGRERLYIGEADHVRDRLIQHDKDADKDFWIRTAVIVSKDENLTKAHGRFLESRLLEMAEKSGRALLKNGTRPSAPPLPESDTADMEFFLEQVCLILPVLGFDFFSGPSIGPADQNSEDPLSKSSPTFLIRRKAEVFARAKEVEGKMVVLKGSKVRKTGVDSWTFCKLLRAELQEAGRIIDDPSDPALLVFAEDVEFASPSAAGAVVLGANTNGRTTWKVEGSGQTYAQWHEAKIGSASAASSDSQ